jgi:serine/threonine protein kinase
LQGLLRNGQVVAIKEFYSTNKSDGTFLHEISTTGIKLQHKNVVKTLGYCVDDQEVCVTHNGRIVMAVERRRMLVMRYMPNGSLADTIIRGMSPLKYN